MGGLKTGLGELMTSNLKMVEKVSQALEREIAHKGASRSLTGYQTSHRENEIAEKNRGNQSQTNSPSSFVVHSFPLCSSVLKTLYREQKNIVDPP